MPISKKDLLAQTDMGEVTFRNTLRCCGLSNRAKEFSDEELARFNEARALLDADKTYAEVAAHFGVTWTVKDKKTATKKKTLAAASDGEGTVESLTDGKKENAALPAGHSSDDELVLDLRALQSRTSARGFPMEFGDLIELMETCKISVDGESIAVEQVEQFDEAVELLKQGKSLEQIRSHFGLSVLDLQTYTFPDLVDASKESGHKVGYGQAVRAIKALGIDPNTREYSHEQAQLIWKAFEIVAAGGSYELVSKLSRDGLSVPNGMTFAQFAERDSSAQLQAMSEAADVRVEGMGVTMAKMEMQALLRELREGEGYNQVWRELGEYMRARKNGKHPKSQSSFENTWESKLLRD